MGIRSEVEINLESNPVVEIEVLILRESLKLIGVKSLISIMRQVMHNDRCGFKVLAKEIAIMYN